MVNIQNIASSGILYNLAKSSNDLKNSVLNLSSGVKQNASVADFSVGTVLASRSSILSAANVNAGQAKSLLETASGALDDTLDLLQQQKTLAVKATDSTLSENDRANLNIQLAAITTEIDRVATNTMFNNKNLLDGTISGAATQSSTTGQATENYTLLTTSDFSFSGTTAAGELDATSSETFAIIESDSVGKTSGSTTITLTHDGGGALSADATFEVGGISVSFGDTNTTTAQLGTSLVAALEASTSNVIRQFIYKDNGDGTITVTGADAGTAVNTTTFQLTDNNSNSISAATLGTSTTIDAVTSTITAAAGSTLGTNRTVASGDKTLDSNLQGGFSNFTAALDTTDTQNQVTFTVDVNGTTYTSQAVNLFGTGGFNSKGDTIANGQLLTFTNTDGPTDASGEYTNNSFTLKIDDALGSTDDIVIAGGTQDAFETDLTNTATAFTTQLAANKINQSRDVILSQVNATGGDFDISTAATGTTFAGIEGFDAVGTNVKGDISFVGDLFGDDGKIGAFGAFAFNSATNIISFSLGSEVYSADISDNTASTGGLEDGAGNYNSTSQTLTVGAGTTIVFHSASTDDGRQLRLDLSNLTDTSIELNTSTGQTTFTDDLDTLFGVSSNTSLSFQVGNESSDTIGVALNSASTNAIYLNDAGTYKALDISTSSGGTAAQEILDNAIDTILGYQATVSGATTSFDSAITSNNSSITSFNEASDALLSTDYALEATLLAEAQIKVNAATSVLAQERSRVNNLMKLLGLG